MRARLHDLEFGATINVHFDSDKVLRPRHRAQNGERAARRLGGLAGPFLYRHVVETDLD